MAGRLGVRWTIGDVSPSGFEALRLSIFGAVRLFGTGARYVVCVNSISVAEARRRTGDVPADIEWRWIPRIVPAVLKCHLDGNIAQGAGWKLLPLRIFEHCYELALDNDVILWDLPEAIGKWLTAAESRCVIAADVIRACGQFADLCGAEPRNSGIRGLPFGYDYTGAVAEVLRRKPVYLASELDEQGLQIAAVSLWQEPMVVSTEEVSICSPFPYHQHVLGRCGAHFVGINMRKVPEESGGDAALVQRVENWLQLREEVHRRLRLNR